MAIGELNEEIRRDINMGAEMKVAAKEAGPVLISLQRLADEVDRLSVAEQAIREYLFPVLGPKRTDGLSEVEADHEDQAPLANDLDALVGRVCAIRRALVETTERLHL